MRFEGAINTSYYFARVVTQYPLRYELGRLLQPHKYALGQG
jgi:hypothetical protein